jgi:enoyl-CoA hydratase/carnithine racemase
VTLDVSINDTVARIVFDRPKTLNALTPSLLRELIERCGALAENESVRVVRLEGEGGRFSSGADLPAFFAELSSGDAQEVADLGRRATNAVAALPQITIAAIRGHCVGGGIVLAGACDLRIAADDARFLVPELDAGIPLGWGGMAGLVRLVGETVAADWVLSCRPFGAQEALRAGLVSRVVQTERLSAELDALAKGIAKKPANVLRATKQQLLDIRAGSFDAKRDASALRAALSDPEALARGAAYMSEKLKRG